jgi:hypothetical protein
VGYSHNNKEDRDMFNEVRMARISFLCAREAVKRDLKAGVTVEPELLAILGL